MKKKLLRKKEQTSLAALEKASTAQEIAAAVALLPDGPKSSATELPVTLKDLLSDIQGSAILDGSDKESA